MSLNERHNTKSIAVLPFINMSADEENEYFSDGITEEILNVLVKVDGLHVTARTSSFAFKGKNKDIRTIGAELGVKTVLEGSVRKAGQRVRITAQLINAIDGYHLWSEKYDRELEDIFLVQDEISLKIVDSLKEKLSESEASDILPDQPTKSLEAYDLYLKGRFHLNKGSKDSTNEAINNFQAAIEKDSMFALPYTGLCACYIFFGGSGIMPSKKAFDKARTFALKANEIDDGIAESHLALAYVSFWDEWNFKNTCMSIANAIQLSPGSADIHSFNSLCMLATNRRDEAFAEIQKLKNLDPLSLKGSYLLGEYYYRTEKYTEAIKQFDITLNQNQYYQQASILKAWSLIFLNKINEAKEIFENIPVGPDNSITFYGGLSYAYLKENNIEKINECLLSLKSSESKGDAYLLNYSYTLIYRSLKDTDKMYKYLEKSLDEKVSTLTFINLDPVWKDYKNIAEFKKLVKNAFNDSINTETFHQNTKYQKSGLKEDDAQRYLAILRSHMEEEKPYLDSSLGLKHLAGQIELSTNQLSQLLNEQLSQNFYDFVNSYRLEEFKVRVKDEKNRNFTLLYLAYDCGFNSKTTFNTFFKKSTGKTPSEYLKTIS